MNAYVLTIGLVLLLLGAAVAEVVTLRPDADANLFEHRPDENYGATEQFQIGLNGAGNRGRGIYRFDIARAGIPAGSIITSAQLEMHVAAAGAGSVPTRHDLFRVQLRWGESNTTWCARDSGRYWTVPGGSAGVDYDATASAGVEVDGVGSYVFESTPELVDDVQRWLDGTAANHGWMLKSDDESTIRNTRRFGAREAGEAAPTLRVEFMPFRVTSVIREEGGRMHVQWTGGTPPFGVETSDDGVTWQRVSGLSVKGNSANVGDQFGEGMIRVRDRLTLPTASARYRVDFVATWSSSTHPDEFPIDAHFSPLIGTTHNSEVSFWQPGGLATPGIERMAERGSTSFLIAELRDAEAAGNADTRLTGSGTGSPGSVSIEFDVAQTHSLVTLVAMIAPSPDWFVGVHGLDLFAGERWADTLTVALEPYDSGTDSGTTYTAPDADTDPADPISRLTGAPFLDGEKRRSIGVFTFSRVE